MMPLKPLAPARRDSSAVACVGELKSCTRPSSSRIRVRHLLRVAAGVFNEGETPRFGKRFQQAIRQWAPVGAGAFVHAEADVRQRVQNTAHIADGDVVVFPFGGKTVGDHDDGVHARLRNTREFTNLIVKRVRNMTGGDYAHASGGCFYHARRKRYTLVFAQQEHFARQAYGENTLTAHSRVEFDGYDLPRPSRWCFQQ